MFQSFKFPVIYLFCKRQQTNFISRSAIYEYSVVKGKKKLGKGYQTPKLQIIKEKSIMDYLRNTPIFMIVTNKTDIMWNITTTGLEDLIKFSSIVFCLFLFSSAWEKRAIWFSWCSRHFLLETFSSSITIFITRFQLILSKTKHSVNLTSDSIYCKSPHVKRSISITYIWTNPKQLLF